MLNIILFNNQPLYQILEQASNMLPESKISHIDDIAKLKTNKNDIIIADLEYLDQLKKIDIYKIILSSNNNQTPGHPIVTKPYHISDVIDKVREIASKFIDVSIQIGEYLFNPNMQELISSDDVISLTEKETKLILLLYKANKPVSKEEILEKIWGYSSDIDTHTIETHIYRIRQKIGKDDDFIFSNSGGYFLSKSLI